VSIERTLRSAIASRSPVDLSYEGDGGGLRTVHPQVLYLLATGRPSIDAYQVAGPTTSGNPIPGWRHFDLDKIQRLSILEEAFEPAPGLNLSSARYARGVLAHV
jgi:predicted DNA-binding transcriptional regulator YafY